MTDELERMQLPHPFLPQNHSQPGQQAASNYPRLSHEQYQHTQHMSPAPLTHTHTDVTNQEEDTLLHLAATSRVTDVQWASAQELLNDRTETAKERSHTHHHN